MIDDYLLSTLYKLPPSNAILLAKRLQMVEVIKREDAILFESSRGFQVLVPTNPSLTDYGHALFRFLRSLEEHYGERTLEDWFGILAFPDSMLFRYTIGDPVANWATLPMDYLITSVAAIFDFIRFTAATVCTQQTFYSRLPEPADDFARHCRLAQTQPGSFRLRLLVPQQTNELATEDSDDDFFGRQVMAACLENLRYLESEPNNKGNGEIVPRSMGPQVAAAVAKLRPPSDFASSEADCDFITPSKLVVAPKQQVALSPMTFTRAEAMVQTYKRVLGRSEEIFKGYITDLHQDAPTPSKETDLNRSVTMTVDYGGRTRKLIMDLLPAQYKSALEWHGESRALFVRAIVDKSTTPWCVYDLKSFRPLDSDEQLPLF